MLSDDGDEVEKEEESLQVRDYLNRGILDRVRVSMGQGSKDHRDGHDSEGDKLTGMG